MNKSIKNTLLYLLIFIGYLLLYVWDVEAMVYPNAAKKVISKVSFVYQQF
jgi:hypothetical protein